METVYVISFAVVAYVVCKYLSRKFSKTPPGPIFHAPVLGDLLYLGARPWETCLQWRETYGDIISAQLGSYSCIVLNNYEDIKDAFSQTVFSGRLNLPAMNLFSGAMEGISERHHWMEQRRFIMRHFGDIGFSKRSSEMLIQDEVAKLLENLGRTSSKPINLNHHFNLATISILWQIIASEKCTRVDSELYTVIEELKRSLRSSSNSRLASLVPWLTLLTPELTGWKRFSDITEKSLYFFMGKILEHEMTLDHESPRDFIDAYLIKIQNKSKDPESSFNNNNGRSNLLSILSSLTFAGSEAIALTLTWACLYLAIHLDVQKKLQEEIDFVVGRSRVPSLEDRSKMPYTEAVIAETFRMSSINQFGGFHRVTEDTEFKGYKIHKDTIMIPNHWAVHHDPKVWGDPENFRPERFLSPDKLRFIKKDGILTFSTGKRSCIGESLARDEVFVFITSLYQRFNVVLNEKEAKPSMLPVPNVLATPQLFTVMIHERN